MGQHDLSYRQFFAHLRMIQDLLREIVGEQWVERIDFDSGELVNTSFVFKRVKNRETDIIWKFRRKDGGDPVYVYVLMEFQSRPDPSMPVRLMVYVGHFYQSPGGVMHTAMGMTPSAGGMMHDELFVMHGGRGMIRGGRGAAPEAPAVSRPPGEEAEIPSRVGRTARGAVGWLAGVARSPGGVRPVRWDCDRELGVFLDC